MEQFLEILKAFGKVVATVLFLRAAYNYLRHGQQPSRIEALMIIVLVIQSK